MSTTRELFTPITDRLQTSNSDFSRYSARAILGALDSAPRGTMRAWMQQNHGKPVTTVQIDTNNGSVWAPTGRITDSSRVSFVELNGSRRYYDGMRVQHTSDNCLIVSDEWHTIAYIREDGINE